MFNEVMRTEEIKKGSIRLNKKLDKRVVLKLQTKCIKFNKNNYV